jgi:predicted acetyltransferase
VNITLEEVSILQKSVLRNLLELYAYDFTEFIPDDVDCHGLYGYKYLDHYWTEAGRHPFVINIDEKIAGFVLVRSYYSSDLKDYVNSIAEFFVMKKYRKRGIGKEAAFRMFTLFPGIWEVAEVEENRPAQGFWRKIIHAYTQGNFEEIQKDDWYGPIQRFSSINHTLQP